MSIIEAIKLHVSIAFISKVNHIECLKRYKIDHKPKISRDYSLELNTSYGPKEIVEFLNTTK